MQKDLEKKLEKLNSILKQKEIIDIFVFGSSVKGKLFPKDIDLLVLFNDFSSSELVLKTETTLEKKGFDAVCIKYLDIKLHPKLVSIVLQEGRSLKFSKNLFNQLNYISFVVYTYNHGLNSTKRTQFSRALNSVESVKFLGKGVLLVYTEKSQEVETIFENFKVDFVKIPSISNKDFLDALATR